MTVVTMARCRVIATGRKRENAATRRMIFESRFSTSATWIRNHTPSTHMPLRMLSSNVVAGKH